MYICTDVCTNAIGETLACGRETEARLVRLASLSSTRRMPDDLCPDRNRGKRTWYAGE